MSEVSLFTTHEFRDRMKVSPSRMEQEVLVQLNSRDIHPMTEMDFCLVSTTPDFYFADSRVAVYLDGPPHKGKRVDRDSQLRELLEKRHHIKVVTIPYQGCSRRERNRIVSVILEALK